MAPIPPGYARPELLATTEWLAEHLADPKVRIVDCRVTTPQREGRAAYLEGHIPGAVYADAYSTLADPDHPVPAMLPSPERMAEVMSSLGIGDDTLVVAYDDAGGAVAGRLWWLLRYYGHDRCQLLYGGIRTWTGEGRPLSTDVPTYPPATFTPRPHPALRETKESVLAALGDPRVTLIDTRLPEVFRGEVEGPGRQGHMPGARNAAYTATFVRGPQTLLPADELRQVYEQAGAGQTERIITTCGAGISAAGGFFNLTLLGHDNITLYDGSWNEWGRDPDVPIVQGEEG